jgi:hypothetical protein
MNKATSNETSSTDITTGDVTAKNGGIANIAGRDIYISNYYATSGCRENVPSRMSAGRKRIFISYKRDIYPDQSLANQLFKDLSAQHDVFIDRKLLVGVDWREEIRKELEECDFLIPLLSGESVQSEMVEYEISTAHNFCRTRNQPVILPVRVCYRQRFKYPLNAYLDPINWAIWDTEADTVRLINELLTAISGGQLSLADVEAKMAVLQPEEKGEYPQPHAFADPIQLEKPGGTMDPESKYYIIRDADQICEKELKSQGVTIVIKAPRQVGKSSLMVRSISQAVQNGKKVAFLDFQLLANDLLSNSAAFYKTFCHWIVNELEIEDRVEEKWSAYLPDTLSCTNYVKKQVLGKLKKPVILAIDEADRMLDCPFRSDFFGMLRVWHNNRSKEEDWKLLDLFLIISTEPYFLIENKEQSPFNVVEAIHLEDFSQEQVSALNRLHGEPFAPHQLSRLWGLLGGHPYLNRQAMYRVANGENTAEEFFEKAAQESGPYGDHLRRHLMRFHDHPKLTRAMLQVIRHQICSDDILFYRLYSAGLAVRRASSVYPRCGLYAQYFLNTLKDE